jgi:C-8 sterol isomerase
MRFISASIFSLLMSATSAAGAARFNPQALHDLAKESIEYKTDHDESLQGQLEYIRARLMQDYPGLINEKPRWIFNHAAGVLVQLQILYCSASEFLIFYGSNLATGGHSGRHGVDIWDIMLQGELRNSIEGELDYQTFRAGEVGFHPRGVAKHYFLSEGGYVLEYARGNVAKGLFDGVLGPALFINQDWLSMRLQLQECTKTYVRQLFRR